jgi:hypothetical protein
MNVLTGLVPGIYVFWALSKAKRGWPDKPGHDGV